MELWHDLSANHYFMLDQEHGQHFRSDQFGHPLPHFRLYDTGHLSPKDRSPAKPRTGPRPRSYDAGCSRLRSHSISPALPFLTPKALSIEGVQASLCLPPHTAIKTALDFRRIMEQTDKDRSGFQPAPPRVKRRTFKGAFQLLYPSAGERYRKDVELWRLTNPEAFRLQKHYEELDLKMLRKRREQRKLQSTGN